MNARQAKAAGYKVIAASAFEVGLTYKGLGVRTWFAGAFAKGKKPKRAGIKLPGLSHPLIQKAIAVSESDRKFMAKLFQTQTQTQKP